ncbi:MAG: leucyl aminopeptidase family protein [Phycisphaeraceae bacterium]|nr:leucyl aminopeptidase family protein [Phycisphaeraceae bacterium]
MFKKITVATVKTARPLIGVFREDLDAKPASDVPKTSRKALETAAATPGFKADVGEVVFADDHLVVGMGDRSALDPGTARKAGAAVLKQLDRAGIDAVRCVARGDCDDLEALAAIGAAMAEGIALANWRLAGFDGTAAKTVTTHPRLRIDWDRKPLRNAMNAGLELADSINVARTVAATPPNVCNPTWIAKEARKVARDAGLKCTILDHKKVKELGMGGIDNVGKASDIPPCLVRLDYTPTKVSKAAKGEHLVLVGKTITYDTGGYSLKLSGGMRGMKYDMCGGAAVLGAIRAIAKAKLGIKVTALLPAAENMVSDEAYRPDDIITMYNGVTVEVTNTDAEGRLVLGDALAYACDKLKPTAIVDVATLTGGVVVALGHFSAGLFANDDRISGAVECASQGANEKVWRLPLWEEHREFMRSPFADILNSNPKRSAHPIQGAAFLSYFVDEDVPWAHLDIAGMASPDADPVTGAGPSGFGVRLLQRFASGMAGG